MINYTVTFFPQNKTVVVEKGKNLLEAASEANITLNNVCGGDGICGRCKMIIKKGEVSGEISGKLTREEIKGGYVLACLSFIQSNVEIEIPEETWAKEKISDNEDAARFRYYGKDYKYREEYTPSPLVTKVFIELDKPDLDKNFADQQRVCNAIRKQIQQKSTQMGLKVIKSLPKILRDNNYRITATVGLRRDIGEVMNIEGGNTKNKNYMAIVDMGTTTIVSHLIDTNNIKTIDAKACFNSQGVYGREVTGRIISAEKTGIEKLQKALVDDINGLIRVLAKENNILLKDINAVICAGNTIMSHFLLGLPTENIRRSPFIATSVDPPPFRAAEVGIQINPRGLLYSLPGISAWVGSDITAGILATDIHKKKDLSLLLDIGTNGEIVIGNKDWIVTTSASAGPALEGAGVECGIRAEKGAIEKIYVKNKNIQYRTIDNFPPKGICGSGIIDLVSVLLNEEIINRSGKFVENSTDNIETEKGIKKFVFVNKDKSVTKKGIYITEADIENVITAKAAIFAAMKILLQRLDLKFSEINNFYIAGAFGNYINVNNAINIGLLPNIPEDRIKFVGNTSIEGAKLVAFDSDAFYELEDIRANTTYYDLMGANDYVEEFKKALFLPHTDIELFMKK